MVDLKKFKRRLDDLPTIPHIVTKLLEVIEDSKSAAKDLGNIISKDEALTSKILKLVNSPFYGLRGKVYSVDHGVVMLGFHNIKNLALGISIFKSIGKLKKGYSFNIEKFWEHSLSCAISSKLIAKTTGYSSPDEAFVAGLLHDIGRLVMYQIYPGEYEEVIKNSKDKLISLKKSEEEVLESTHTMVGEWAAKEWKLPPFLSKSIRYHHNPARSTQFFTESEIKLIIIVNIGNILCKKRGYCLYDGEPVTVLDDYFLGYLKLRKEKIDSILSGIDEEMVSSKKLFGLG